MIRIFIMASILSFLFGCSKKEQPANKTDIFPKESFSVVEAKLKDGRPIVGSINKGYKNYKNKNDFPWCLKLAIALNHDKLYGNGLPLAEESKIANQLEDELTAEINKLTTAHYIGHIFNDSFLDVYFYLPEPEKVHDFLQTQINKKGLLREFGYEINKDPKWETVDHFLSHL